jgi:outer membrane protein OmpA-like peptidoglycan-associated protein
MIGQSFSPKAIRDSTSAWYLFGVVLFVLVMLTGCAPKSYIVLLESPDGSTGQVIVKGQRGEQILSKSGDGTSIDGSAPPAPIESDRIKKDFGAAMAARPKLPVRYLLYFKTGTTLTSESEALIPKIIAEAASRPALDLSVIGHTDTVFTSDYNEQLANKRATTVAQILKAKGLNVHAMTVESHGKRNLLVITPDNTFEPRNRRVEVSIR